MNEIVQNYIETKRKELKQKKQKEKNEKLIDLGLYEKVYAGEEGYVHENIFYEWDSSRMINTTYNKKAIEVTDEEYEEILKVSETDKETGTWEGKNIVATILKVIAWIIYIGGFIIGIIMAEEMKIDIFDESYRTDFSVGTALTYWFVTLISGTLFLGFAEVIVLLEKIKKNQKTR